MELKELNARLMRAADYIRQADALLITAGAGMSVNSGLPDFRGDNGFWRAFPPLEKLGKSFVQMATPDLFYKEPTLAWGFYGWRLNAYRNTIPHEGFRILKAWSEKMKYGAFVYTSNVDGQFQKTGFDSERVVECHGSIHHLQCCLPCDKEIWSADKFFPSVNERNCTLISPLPACPHCGGMVRPNILMFNDGKWLPHRMFDQEKRFSHWIREVENLVIIELGAGTVIPTVRNFSQSYSEHFKAPLVRINTTNEQVKQAQDIGLPFGALEALQQMDNLVSPE
ncbi:SIR2 family NAD-dependent protein deacylase [Suttonella ornithocola]|uniref:protein acetyllysine N-acetyltransferase n=1 Tax=Suttonella ornithocola TaxID=279832 RepID=A0A380RB51_9GAMM|nr:Sir2 family NAD-dependent protein deacetylase [Suttonella ornithocola]SUO95327.1 NAD-dependent deacetylase [Suttonella ornithocola]SUQ09732.1 NAD-dependent deacetylase [Suttonella ornithocola]